MSYDYLIQVERDLSEAITLLMRLGNEQAGVSVGGFSKLVHAELYLRAAHSAVMENFAEAV